MQKMINAVRWDIGTECIRLDTTPCQIFQSDGEADKWLTANNVKGAKWQGYVTIHLR